MSRQNAGYIVETKSGKQGVALHKDPPVNGKVAVTLEDGSKILCTRESLKFIGFQD